MLRFAIALLPLAFVTLAGCSDGGFDGTITLNADSFSPKSATVDAGDEVHFEVASGTHTVTIHMVGDPTTTLKLDQSVSAGDDAHFTFAAAGTYHVWCKLHGTMTSGMAMVVTVE
mgnify:CR=1 FL=1